jgi:DNA-binding response OmpR family regulator
MNEVLIVDDDQVHAEIAGMVLKRAGFSVRRAVDGPLALEALAAEPLPDLVLLDVMLPKLDGFEVLRRIRADARTEGLPVIMVTSFSRDQDAARGRALGANDYIVKPLMDADFLRRVRAALQPDPPGS